MSAYNPKDTAGAAPPPPVQPGPPAPAASTAPAASAAPPAVAPHFTIGVADKDGREIPPDDFGFSNPSAREARHLVFDVHIGKDRSPSAEEMGFYRELAKVEHTLQTLYPDTVAANEARFRPFFVRLFYVSQLVLEGDVQAGPDKKKTVGQPLAADAAKAEIAAIVSDLIDDEAPRVKNGHMRELARWAGRLSLPFIGAYVVLLLMQPGPGERANVLMGLMQQLGVDPAVAANFMLLWVGSFAGVCLSYAIRTHTFALADLTRSDDDYLAPQIRLLLTGAFAALLVLFCIVGLGDVELGSIKLSDITIKPMLAFVVGAVLGIGEKKLSGTIEKRTGVLLGNLDK